MSELGINYKFENLNIELNIYIKKTRCLKFFFFPWAFLKIAVLFYRFCKWLLFQTVVVMALDIMQTCTDMTSSACDAKWKQGLVMRFFITPISHRLYLHAPWTFRSLPRPLVGGVIVWRGFKFYFLWQCLPPISLYYAGFKDLTQKTSIPLMDFSPILTTLPPFPTIRTKLTRI